MGHVSVLIVDDHTVLRQGLRRILEGDPSIDVVGEAGDGHAAIALVEKLRPAVVLLDIGLPLMNGIETTRALKKRKTPPAVLMLSMHTDRSYVQSSLQAGANGYLLKDADGLDVVRAVNAVAAGGSYFSPAVAALVLDQAVRPQGDASGDPLQRLTARERQVLQLVAEGKSNKEVAVLLDLGVSTIESHRKSAMEKLDLHNTAELVRFAIRYGVIAG